jgi:hypothetical protein
LACDVITPKEDEITLVFGAPNRTRLNALKQINKKLLRRCRSDERQAWHLIHGARFFSGHLGA